MPSQIAIIVEHLTKVYKLYSSPVDRLKESLHPLRRRYHHEFYALSDVSFTINRGESVGIVGKNGSGKSTLLKILTGVLTPSSGCVTVNGKISALLELGAGFNPELSGIENVYFNGMLMGYSRDEMDKKLDDILAFADIGEFVFQPVKTYSSGMFVRLAFAVAVNVEPEIMIIDEALSVGDVFFQQKCVRKMDAFKDNGGSIVFVSHDMNSVKILCHNALFLDSGTVKSYGSSSGIVDMYLGMILKESSVGVIKVDSNIDDTGKMQTRLNSEGVSLLSSKIYNKEGNEINIVTSEELVFIDFIIQSANDYAEPSYGIIIRNKHGVSVFETNSYCMNEKVRPLNANEIVTVRFAMNLNLRYGNYAISFGCANKGIGSDGFEEILMLEHDAIALTIIENKYSIKYDGITNLKPTIIIS